MREVRTKVALRGVAKVVMVALAWVGWTAVPVSQVAAQPVNAGTLSFTSTNYIATEFESVQGPFALPDLLPTINDRSVRGALITVVRTAGSSGRVQVSYSTIDTNTAAPDDTNSNLAIPTVDYTPTSGTLVFDDFQMSRSFVVPIRPNFLYRGELGDKVVFLQLSAPSAPEEDAVNPGLIVPTLGTFTNAAITIRDPFTINGGTNFMVERASYMVNESDNNGGNITIDVDVIHPSGSGGSVEVNVVGREDRFYVLSPGSDFAEETTRTFFNSPYSDGATNIINFPDFGVINSRTIQFAAGQSRRSITITITNDDTVEFNEDIFVFLRRLNNQPPLGLNSSALVTILYQDPPAGSLDREWNPDGVHTTVPRFNLAPGANSVVRSLAIQADQRTIIGGDFTAYNSVPINYVARINLDGSFDPSFNPGGAADEFVSSVAVYPGFGSGNDGKIVIGGGFTSFDNELRPGVARLNPNGSLDSSFAPGSGANGIVRSVAVQSDGKVLVAGDFSEFNGVSRHGIARLNLNGSVDTTFNPGAGADAVVWSLGVRDQTQTNRVIRVAEITEITDYNEIETGSSQGTMTIDYVVGTTSSLRVYYEGNLVDQTTVVGTGQWMVSYGGGTSTKVTIVVNEGSGVVNNTWRYTASILAPVLGRKIFIGGEFISYNGVVRGGVARLNDDGSLDAGFDPGGGADGTVYAVYPQPDGRVLVGGSFTMFDFRNRSRLARLGLDGALDTTYDPGSGANDTVYSITLQSDGKALVGGLFTSFNGTRRIGLTRLFVNGTVDTSFMDTAYNQFAGLINAHHYEAANYVNTIAVQADGNVMIGGAFDKVGGNASAVTNNIRGVAVAGDQTKVWSRADKRARANVARLVGGYTPGPGNLEFVYANNTVDEGAGQITIATHRLDGRLGGIAAQAGTANLLADSSDYDPFAGNVTLLFRPEDAQQSGVPISVGFAGELLYNIPINPDTIPEGNETFALTMGNPVGGMILGGTGTGLFRTGGEPIAIGGAFGRSSATVTIADDDFPKGTLVFSSATYFTNENAGAVRITVLRTNGSAGPIQVKYLTFSGPGDTAVAGSDYIASQGTLTFGSGVTSVTFTNVLLDDFTVEAQDETFSVVLTNLSDGVSFPGGVSSISATVSIIDNDYLPGRANFASATYSTNEGAGFARVTLVRRGGSVGPLSVSVAATNGSAIGGVDYTAVTNTVSWVHGDVDPKTFLVPLLDDSTVEGDETIGLRMFNPSPVGGIGTISTATLTVVDDDLYGKLSFSQPIYDADERGTNVTITVVRTSGLGGTVSADYQVVDGTAVNGTDFSAANGTLTLGPGVSAATFSIVINDNGLVNGERSATLNLVNLVNATLGTYPTATLSIIDDESFGDPAGSIDTTFSTQAGANDSVNALAIQPNGKILAAGAFRTMNRIPRNRIARLNPDGTLDGAFNAGPGPNQPIRAMVLQPDGRIVIGGLFDKIHGTNRNFIARLLSDGSVDAAFNPGAGADNPVFTLSLLDDGGVVMGGSFAAVNGVPRPGIAVLNSDGKVRISFDPGVGVDGTVFATAVQPDGKILIGGDFQTVQGAGYKYIARLHPSGLVDSNFDPGSGPNGPVRAIGIQADGKILIGGSFTTVDGTARVRIARLLGDGSLDPFYQAALTGANGDVLGISLQFDGKAIVVGDFTNFNAVARNNITRLLPNGKTDTSINFGSGANQAINTALVQPDRRIVIGGRFTSFDGEPRNYIARLHGGSIAGTGRLQFSTPFYEVAETLGQMTIVVERHGGTAGDVAVDYSTTAGSATPDADYTNVVGTLVFPEGEVRQTFTIPIVNDLVGELPEDVILSLSNPTGDATLGDIPLALLTIISDDSQIGFSSATYSVIENAVGGSLLISVLRTGATNGGAQVNFATTTGTALAGSDYSPVSGVLTFVPGQTTQTFVIPIIDDNLIEPSETVGLVLSNVIGSVALGQATATVTIVDNDFRAGTLTFGASSYSTNEAAGAFTIVVLRTNGSTGPISVNYATAPGNAVADVDYTSASGTLTFIEGQTSAVITVPIIDDAVVEGDENLSVSIFNPTGGATIAGVTNVTAIIEDNEFGPGSLDLGFESGAGANGLVRSIALQANGRIILGGGFTQFDNAPRAYVARVESDGSLDTSFDPGTGANGFVSGVGATLSGRVVIAGVFSQVNGVSYNRVAQLLDDGTPDLNFNRNAQFNAGVNTVTVQSNGRILLGGGFSLPTRGISRLQASGAIDTTFSPANGADGQVHSIAIQPDGKVVMGGAFSSVGGELHARIARVDATGLLDIGFLDGAITNGTVFSVAMQVDGKIIVGGDFQTSAGTNRVGLARLNSDGTLDPGFDVGSGANGTVYAIGIQSTGRIIVAGDFTGINGTNRNRYARLNVNGSLDLSFDPGQGANNTVFATIVLPDDNIIIAGDFTAVTGVPRFGLARIRGTDPGPAGAFSAVSVSAGVLHISISTHPGQTCILEATTNFVQWSPIATNVAVSSTCVFDQPNMSAYPARFFRIRQIQP